MENLDFNVEHWQDKNCPPINCKKKTCECGLEKVFLPATLGDDGKTSQIAPKNGAYCDAIVVYEANGHIYIYSKEGIPTLITSGGGGDYDEIIKEIQEDLAKTEGDLAKEVLDRAAGDKALQDEIDDMKNSPDVVDIVATYAALQAYDTSKLGDNDIIRVLADETHDGQSTYYRWDKHNSVWTYIGTTGDYYTKGQVNTLLADKQDKLTAGTNVAITQVDNDLVISATDTTYTAGTNVSISSGNVISATNTTYSNFVGTDGIDPGVAGLVPAPTTADADKFLKSDGTWATVGGGGSGFTTLTSADYNYPANNPTAVNPGMMTPGIYFIADDTVNVYDGNNTNTGKSNVIFIVSKAANDNTLQEMMVINDGNGSGTSTYKIEFYYVDKTTGSASKRGGASGYGVLDGSYVVDTVTNTSSKKVLSANMGKNLNDKIIKTPYFIAASDLPAVGSTASGKSLFTSRSMGSGNKTNGQNFLNMINNDNNDHNWKLKIVDYYGTAKDLELFVTGVTKSLNAVSPSPTDNVKAMFTYSDSTATRTLTIWAEGTGNDDFYYSLV